jgi:hypothetical protein
VRSEEGPGICLSLKSEAFNKYLFIQDAQGSLSVSDTQRSKFKIRMSLLPPFTSNTMMQISNQRDLLFLNVPTTCPLFTYQ